LQRFRHAGRSLAVLGVAAEGAGAEVGADTSDGIAVAEALEVGATGGVATEEGAGDAETVEAASGTGTVATFVTALGEGGASADAAGERGAAQAKTAAALAANTPNRFIVRREFIARFGSASRTHG